MADNLRSSTKVGENPTFATTVSKQEGILGDKAVGGMDNDKDHVENVIGGLKAVPGGEFSFSRLGGRHCNPSFSFSFDAQS